MKLVTVLLAPVCATVFLVNYGEAGALLDSTVSDHTWIQTALEEISSERMMADIAQLSGPAFGGRQTGTDEDRESAIFIANRFSALRLQRSVASPPESLTNSLPRRAWNQTAPVMTTTIHDNPVLQINLTDNHLPLHIGSDFLPILDSPSTDMRAPIVFVGYGLSDSVHGVDDYAGLDVRDKIVLFLRGKPEMYKGAAAHVDKERTAKENGAIAYLTATGPILSPYEQRRGVTGKPSAYYSDTDVAYQLPGAWISTEIAATIVQGGTQGHDRLRTIQEAIFHGRSTRSFTTGVTAQLTWNRSAARGTLYNVASLISGYSPHTDETVIIGAHRDHFGRQGGLFFAGADDNASGTAVMMEVARIIASAPTVPKRSILFLSFSGEEQGLLGSHLYVSQPIAPLTRTVSMINIDHAGVGNGRLTVGVTGLEKTGALAAAQTAGLSDQLDLFGFFPGGDHVPFKEAGVPTIAVVSGGIHPHFHQPSDTADTIDPDILKTVARYVLALTWRMANEP